jgi:probable HAF family extracellular repeat protein
MFTSVFDFLFVFGFLFPCSRQARTKSPRRRPAHQRSTRSCPAVEPLEGRWCPSGYTPVLLGTLGGSWSEDYAINNQNPTQVVGMSIVDDLSGVSHPFLWTDGATDGVPSNPQMKDLRTLGGESIESFDSAAYALNGAGHVAGQAPTAGGAPHAFLWKPGATDGVPSNPQMKDLGTLGGASSRALGINSADVVVGDADGSDNQGHAFLWVPDAHGGTMNDVYSLLPPNSGWTTLTEAVGVNDKGQIAGTGVLVNGQTHAYLYTDSDGDFTTPGGTITDLGTLNKGSRSLVGWANGGLNAKGQVAGTSQLANGAQHAFLWSPARDNGTSGKMADLGTLSGGNTPNNSGAKGLNNSGYVVGQSVSGPFPHQFVWPGRGTMQDLSNLIPSSWYIGVAYGINDAGWIVAPGGRRNVDTRDVAVLWKPAGAALTAAAAATNPVRQVLTPAAVRSLLSEAVARWAAAGANTSALSGVSVLITDLPGAELGEAMGKTVSLDTNAAGWGWFIDPTPRSDAEFTTPGDQGEQNRMDLLTVLEHELGHVLGYAHSATGVMIDTLPPGTRRTPRSAVSLSDPVGREWAALATALDTPRPKQRQS